jgi:hypothetical protein
MVLPMISSFSSYPAMSLLLVIFGWITQHHIEVKHFLNWVCHQLSMHIFIRKYRKLILRGRIMSVRSLNYCHMTNEMKGVFLYLHRNIDRIGRVKNVEAIDVSTSYGGDGERKTLNVPIQPHWVEIGDGLSVMVQNTRKEKRRCAQLRDRALSEKQYTYV